MERKRERELTFFAMNNLEGIGEKVGNEVKEIYKKIKLEEEAGKASGIEKFDGTDFVY